MKITANEITENLKSSAEFPTETEVRAKEGKSFNLTMNKLSINRGKYI